MGRLTLALMIVLLPVQNAISYTIIDVDVFYAFYEKPRQVIDFSEFKDGIPIADISEGSQLNEIYKAEPECLVSDNTDEGSFEGLQGIAVQPDAFSDDWSFMAVNPKNPASFCKAVIWFDQRIASGTFNIAVIAASGHSKPFVLYTNKGFLGIIPDSPDETVFIFDNISAVFVFETDFPMPSSLSDQTDKILAVQRKRVAS